MTVTLVFAGRLRANAVGWAFCGVTDKNPLVLKENQPPVLVAMAARAGGFCVALEKLPESCGQGNLLGDFRRSFPNELFVLSGTGEVYAVEFPFHMGEDVFPFYRLRQIRGLAVPCTGLGNGFFGSADAGNIGIFPKPVEQPLGSAFPEGEFPVALQHKNGVLFLSSGFLAVRWGSRRASQYCLPRHSSDRGQASQCGCPLGTQTVAPISINACVSVPQCSGLSR